jgi:hypothetical protein
MSLHNCARKRQNHNLGKEELDWSLLRVIMLPEKGEKPLCFSTNPLCLQEGDQVMES